MRNLRKSAVKTFNTYPFSMVAFIISLLPWVLVYMALFNIRQNPAPAGVHDFRGEGLAYGSLLAIAVAIIFISITVLNLIFNKPKTFYVRLLATAIGINFLCFCVGWVTT